MLQRVMVSVGIPNYNYAKYIEHALNSVINQTYQNMELIIVDDCSTDNSVAVIDNWINKYNGDVKIKFIKNPVNAGLTKVCNIILQHANGRYFQTLDADDLILPNKIERQVELLEKNANAAFIYSNIGLMDETGKMMPHDYLEHIGYDKNNMPEGNIFTKLFDFNFIPLPSVLVNRILAVQAGGYNEMLQVQDYYLWFKLAEKFEVLYMKDITALYRLHSSSMSNSDQTNPKSVESVLSIKYTYFDRSSRAIQKIIKKNVFNSSPYLYQYQSPSAKYWLKKNVVLNPGIKSLGYYLGIHLGIPYNFFTKIKSIFST